MCSVPNAGQLNVYFPDPDTHITLMFYSVLYGDSLPSNRQMRFQLPG